MTRDVAAQAVHERLEHLVGTMAEPDIEAGWAALVAQLEPQIAPVVPLRRRSRLRRTIVLGVAAAMLLAGAAFAAVRYPGTDTVRAPVQPVATSGRVAMGPHTHPPLSGPPPRAPSSKSTPPGRHHGGTEPGRGRTPPRRSTGDPSSSRSTHHHAQPSHHDAPDDTDQGTGNDGTHDDNGQGNDAQGQNGHGNGNGGGSGKGQGSGSGQGSGDLGGHTPGSKHRIGGQGSNG